MKLLEGTNIYQNKYVGIRELVQNAVDASLLQMWHDITHNRYIRFGVSKHGHRENKAIADHEPGQKADKKEMELLEHEAGVLEELFGNYPITIELIKDLGAKKVFLTVKDRGTGITPQDAAYMVNIGASKEKNDRILDIMKDMPRWMKPSGVFGIGLQSVFQLTDQIEFYSRRPNEPERKIVFNSYRRNHGRIEIHEVDPDEEGIYYDNATQGTNVKIAIDPERLSSDSKEKDTLGHEQFLYYDTEFNISDNLQALYAELAQAIMITLRENLYDYFNIYYQSMTRDNEDTQPIKDKLMRLRTSYFSPHRGETKRDIAQSAKTENSILSFYPKDQKNAVPYSFVEDKAYYADVDSCRIYQLTVRKGKIEKDSGVNCFQLPERVRNLYDIQYKFNPILNADFIYPPSVRQLKQGHAGFLRWNINIMDENPDKYLNIDRVHLREGSIMEEELEEIQNEVLRRWCDYLIERQKRSEDMRLKREHRAKGMFRHMKQNEEFQQELSKNPFKGNPQLLVSFAMLFYQYVPMSRFREFIEPYRSFLKEQELILKGEDFQVERLWEEDAVFQSFLIEPPKWIKEGQFPSRNFSEIVEISNIHAKTLERIPHRLIRVFRISLNQEKELTYYFKFGQYSAELCMLEMDYAARLHDYSGVIGPLFSTPSKIDIDSLVNKVFKPNGDFPHLLVSRNPKSFERGGNFSSPLDHYIRWYILSPFDRSLTKWLRDLLKGTVPTPTPAELKAKIEKYIADSTHIKKCVNYAYRQYEARMELEQRSLPEDLLKTMQKEYTAFLEDFCQILIENKDLISKKFEK